MSLPPDKSPPAPADTVELVGFQPTLNKEGAVPFNEIEAAAAARRVRNFRLIVFTLILLIPFSLIVGPPLYRAAKGVRAAGLAHTAVRQMEKGQTDEAVQTVRAAYMMAPDNGEVLRAMAVILTALNAPSAQTYWGWVLELPNVTDLDRREAAECALRQGSYTRAGDIIDRLLKDDPKSAPNLLMAARYYALGGSPSEAMAFATRSAEADPGYAPAALFLAVQKLNNPYLHQEGVDALFKTAQNHDVFALLSLERLAQEPNLRPDEVARALALLEARPQRDEATRLATLIFQLRKNPQQRNDLLAAAVAAHQGASDDDLELFANWLNSIDESARVLDLISSERAQRSKSLFVAYLDALGAMKKWSAIEAALSANNVPLERTYVELYLYRCAKELGDPETTDLHWRAAQVTASHNPRDSLYLADYAANLGDNDRAETIYRTLTRDRVTGRHAYMGLLRVDWSKSTRTMADLLDEMAVRWPDDEGVINDDVYYHLLLRQHVPEMARQAETLVKNNPYSAAHLTTLALARLRQHDDEGALKVYEGSHIPWDTAAPSTVAVYAATLEANGRDRLAHRISASIPRDKLRPEEAALIRDLL